MKKVVKWTAYVLVLAAVVTAVVCYSAFPTETKRAIDKIMQYANTPIAIAGVSTTVAGVLAFVVAKYVFSNTKFGRRELDSMKDRIEGFEKRANRVIEEYESKFENLKSEYESKFDDLKGEVENKVTVVYTEFEDLQKTLLESLKAFPNKRIQELVAQYEASFAERKEEIIDKTVNSNEFIDKKIEEIKSQYESMFNELLDKVEKTLNEEAKDA